MKRELRSVLSLILAAVLVLSVFVSAPVAASATDSAKTSGDWKYTVNYYDDNGKYVKAGYSAVLTDYTGKNAEITLPEKLGNLTVREVNFWDAKYATKTVTKITLSSGVDCVYGLTGLKNLCGVSCNAKNKSLAAKNGILYDKNYTSLVCYPPAKKASVYTAPDTLTYLALGRNPYVKTVTMGKNTLSAEFYSCQLLSTVTPSAKTHTLWLYNCPSIKKLSLTKAIRYLDIIDCVGLNSFAVASANKYYSVKDNVLYNKNQTQLVKYPQAKTDKTFAIPEGVKSLHSAAITDNPYLTAITLPATLEKLSNNLDMAAYIRDLPKLTAVKVAAKNKYYTAPGGVLMDRKQTTLMLYPRYNKAASYAIPSTVTAIQTSAFEDAAYLQKVTVPSSVKTVGSCAFAGCISLKSVTLPKSVTGIAYASFYGCKNLTGAFLGSKVKTIGMDAFTGCTSLKALTLPKTVSTMSEYAFGYNYNASKQTWSRNAGYLRGYKGGAVEKFAAKNKIKFIDILPQSVKLDQTALTLGAGESCTLAATLTPVNRVDMMQWTSSAPAVAAVNSSGKVTAVKAGTATVTLTTSNGKKAACKITVRQAPTKLSLNKSSATLAIGKTLTLVPQYASGQGGNKVTYTSSAASVASVSADGVVTAEKAGAATITVAAYNGKKATCKITVK